MSDKGHDAPMNQPIPMFDLLGVRPIWVEGLAADALILLEERLVLVRADLDARRITQVIDQVLEAVTETLSV